VVVYVWGYSDGLAYTGWQPPERERRRLAERFPPTYAVDPDVQHHVTFRYGVNADSQLPDATSGLVVEHADDLKGVQALVVEVDGGVRRPDGSIYHITWSLDGAAGCRPVDSNGILLAGWRGVADSDRVDSAVDRCRCGELPLCRRKSRDGSRHRTTTY
jgi:hypothetical protein